MQTPERHPVTRKRVLYELADAERATVAHDTRYGDELHTFDAYYPPNCDGTTLLPAVIFVSGLSDLGAVKILGCRISQMESFISWSRLTAASGMIAITHTTGADPASDVTTLLDYLESEGRSHGVDGSRLALWACSSHVPNALGQLVRRRSSLKCAALCYGFMLDLDDATGVAEAQHMWRFVNPSHGRPVQDLPSDTPIMIVRSGRDETLHVNASIDRFVPNAIAANLPITFVNHHAAPHAFDLDHDSEETRRIVSETLTFLKNGLNAGPPPDAKGT